MIIHGKCENEIPKLENNSIDLMITSPPYNVDLGNNKKNKIGYDNHNDNMKHEDYILWLKTIFRLLKPKMKKDGRIVINIGDGKNGMYPTHAHIINFMISELKYNILSTIIWNKNNTSSRTTWGSWLSPSSPSFPTPFEYILIFYNEVKKKQKKGKTDLTKKEFIDNSLALWQFAGEKKKNTNHPAAFPVELPYRCIKQLTWVGDTVLDIFAGAGTTGVAAKQLNRKYILIEKSLDYVNLIKKRLEDTQISIF